MNQIISKQVILNKSDEDQNLLIAGELVQVGAGNVQIVEIGLYAFNLRLHTDSTFVVNEMVVTFLENPDGTYTATIAIPEDMEPTINPTDMLALLNNVIPVQQAPNSGNASSDDVGYWAAGKVTGMIVPAMIIHHVYKSGVKKKVKKEVSNKVAEEISDNKKLSEVLDSKKVETVEAKTSNMTAEDFAMLDSKYTPADKSVITEDLDNSGLDASKIESEADSFYKDQITQEDIDNLGDSNLSESELEDDLTEIYTRSNSDTSEIQVNEEFTEKMNELDTESANFDLAVKGGADQQQIASEELDGQLLNKDYVANNYDTKLSGDVGGSQNLVNANNKDVTNKVETDSTGMAEENGLVTNSDGAVVENSTPNVLSGAEKLSVELEDSEVVELVVANPEILA